MRNLEGLNIDEATKENLIAIATQITEGMKSDTKVFQLNFQKRKF